MVPPVNPKVRDLDCSTWKVSHKTVNGGLQDSFKSTSLHLSLTGYQVPIETGRRGFRDDECMIIETAISVYDGGEWVADLDVSKSFKIPRKHSLQSPCRFHSVTAQQDISKLKLALCVDSWVGLLDSPSSTLIVRACNNSAARLAAVCLTV